MKFKSEIQTVITWPLANLVAGIVGLLIVWCSTHSWLAILGCFISALHFQFRVENKQ